MINMMRSVLLSALAVVIVGCNEGSGSGVTGADTTTLTQATTSQSEQAPALSEAANEGALDFAESTHLVFMREEEKLARDIYLTFFQWYPHQTVFKNISESEQTHTDVMRDKLAQFGIPDPNPDTNNLPASIGVFTGKEYGPYMTETFAQLTEKGTQDDLAALYVGALIEELDMHDIVKCPDEIVALNSGMSVDSCGLDYTDEPALTDAYTSLLDASKNHLRAFVKQIESVIGEGRYEAQFLTQEEVNAILGR